MLGIEAMKPKERGYVTGIDKADDRLKFLPVTQWYYYNPHEIVGLLRERIRELEKELDERTVR